MKARITLTVWSSLRPLSSFFSVLSASVVVVAAEGDGELADLLDQLVGFGAFLLADHIAEDAAQQADVFDQGAFVVFGALARGARCRFVMAVVEGAVARCMSIRRPC